MLRIKHLWMAGIFLITSCTTFNHVQVTSVELVERRNIVAPDPLPNNLAYAAPLSIVNPVQLPKTLLVSSEADLTQCHFPEPIRVVKAPEVPVNKIRHADPLNGELDKVIQSYLLDIQQHVKKLEKVIIEKNVELAKGCPTRTM